MSFRSLNTVLRALPFPLDDTAKANAAFLDWRTQHTPHAKRIVDLWTYAYIYRYFLIKFAPTARHMPVSLDQLVARTFADVDRHLDRVRRPERYTGWVATICKHTFVNHIRIRYSMVSLNEEHPVLAVDDVPEIHQHDAAVVLQAVSAAIDALPLYLREVTRMRLLESKSYDAISAATGHTPATLRSYLNKAITQLRRHPDLQNLVEELRD